MRVIRDFSERALDHIKVWTWAAAVLPITALAGIFFIWAFGSKSLFELAITTGATIMFAVAAVWWWWIIWIVSKIIRKDRKVAEDLKNTTEDIKNIKHLFRETFNKNDK